MNNYPFKFVGLLAFALTFLSSCSEDNYPNETEVKNFCLILEDAINSGSPEFINKVFDTEPLIDNVIGKIEAPEYYSNGFKNGFQQTYSLGDVLVASAGFEGYSTFLKLNKYSQDTIIALYRSVTERGLNYQELYLKADEEGELHIFDLYSYAEGDLFSESIKRLYIINLATEIDTYSHPIADNLPVINEIAALADRGNFAEAFQKLEALPQDVKNEKIVQIIRLNIANEVSKGTLNTVAEDFKQRFPNDNLIYLKLMDLAFVRQDLPDILSSIDSLDKIVAGDAYLKVIKAGVYRDNAQDDLAEKLVRQAINEEPANDDGYWLLVDMLIIQKRYDEAIEVFGEINKAFKENAAEYVVYDGYEEFYNSTPFKEWILKHPIDTASTIINEDAEHLLHDNDDFDDHHHHNHEH